MRKMIDMAREAGMTGLESGGLFDNFLVFEELVRADERESCAQAASDFLTQRRSPLGKYVADVIRARGRNVA